MTCSLSGTCAWPLCSQIVLPFNSILFPFGIQVLWNGFILNQSHTYHCFVVVSCRNLGKARFCKTSVPPLLFHYMNVACFQVNRHELQPIPCRIRQMLKRQKHDAFGSWDSDNLQPACLSKYCSHLLELSHKHKIPWVVDGMDRAREAQRCQRSNNSKRGNMTPTMEMLMVDDGRCVAENLREKQRIRKDTCAICRKVLCDEQHRESEGRRRARDYDVPYWCPLRCMRTVAALLLSTRNSLSPPPNDIKECQVHQDERANATAAQSAEKSFQPRFVVLARVTARKEQHV